MTDWKKKLQRAEEERKAKMKKEMENLSKLTDIKRNELLKEKDCKANIVAAFEEFKNELDNTSKEGHGGFNGKISIIQSDTIKEWVKMEIEADFSMKFLATITSGKIILKCEPYPEVVEIECNLNTSRNILDKLADWYEKIINMD